MSIEDNIIGLGAGIVSRNPAQIARELIGIALDIYGNEADLKDFLTEAARKRADAIADAATDAKVGR